MKMYRIWRGGACTVLHLPDDVTTEEAHVACSECAREPQPDPAPPTPQDIYKQVRAKILKMEAPRGPGPVGQKR